MICILELYLRNNGESINNKLYTHGMHNDYLPESVKIGIIYFGQYYSVICIGNKKIYETYYSLHFTYIRYIPFYHA